MLGMHMIKDLAAGIIALLASYGIVDWAADSFSWFSSGIGMTAGIIVGWTGIFLILKYSVLR